MNSFFTRSLGALVALSAVFVLSITLLPHTASAAAALTATSATISSNNASASTTISKIGDTISFTLGLSGTPWAQGTSTINIFGMGSTSMTSSTGAPSASWTYSTTSVALWTEGPITFYIGFGNIDGTATTTISQTGLTGANVVFDKTVPTTPTGLTSQVFHGTSSFSLASTDANYGVRVLYTLDGSTPTCTVGTVYSSAVSVSQSTTVTAVACDAAYNLSSAATGVYSPAAGGGYVPPATAAAQSTVNLGSAGNFAVLSKSGISATGVTAVTGDIGVSPISSTAITGFGLVADATNVFSKSSLVSGRVYASDYAVPSPATMSAAVSDMQTAYVNAAGRTNPTATELGAGNIGGMTLAPGLYKWSSNVTIPTDVTLLGGANDVWIFQIAGNLDISSAKKVILSGGAQASNVFWQVAGQATLGTTSVFNGNILSQTLIALRTGATLNGRALAQTAVTLDAATVTSPAGTPAAPATPATPAVPATPATPASTGTAATPATPATPAAPATPATTATGHASGLSAGQVQAILDVLASFNADASVIANVRASLGGATTGSVVSAAVHAFKTNLTIGSLGSEVKALQQYLNAHGYTVSTSGAGSTGNETSMFGNATKAALIKFQKAHNITPAVGYFGATTRAAVNANN